MARGRKGKKAKRAPGGAKGQNRKSSDNFLEKNRRDPDVQVTDSGLQYTIVKEGDGLNPAAGDTVVVHQRIVLIDGKVIDDTYRTNTPEEFEFNEAIPGYKEGLQMMKVGGRRKFFIPPDLAWGKRGAGSKIGPNAVVIIDAALIKIKF